MGEGDSVVSRVAREEEGVLPAAKPLPEKERAIYKEGRERERGEEGRRRHKERSGKLGRGKDSKGGKCSKLERRGRGYR